MKYLLPLTSIWVFLYGCKPDPNNVEIETSQPATAPIINFSVSKYYPHDTSYYTEGLTFHNGRLYESTGSPDLQTKSLVAEWDLGSGEAKKIIELDNKKYFGEGIIFINNKLFQITYKNQIGFIYDATTFKQTGSFTYKNKEGWALTTDGKSLIMSDGTDVLTYLSADSLQPTKWLKVTENGRARDSLNELEYINGFIYANIWYNDHILKIDPANGKVVGKLDLSSLSYEASTKNPGSGVLNGIAYDPSRNLILVTGKNWPNIYEIKFVH